MAERGKNTGGKGTPADDAEHQEVRFVQRFAAAGR